MTETAKRENEKEEMKDPWLPAFSDTIAGIRAYSNCIKLVDMYGDGDHRLAIADQNRGLKVYKDTNLDGEISISGVPSCIASFYPDTNQPRIPLIAVAIHSSVHMYRSFQPHHKFTIPPVDIHADEVKIWEAMTKCTIEIPVALKKLTALRSSNTPISERSRGLLALGDIEGQAEYVTRFIDDPLEEHTNIMCMTAFNKSMEDKTAVSCLVIAAENGQVYILDPHGTSITQQVMLPSVPVDIAACGLLDVEYRLIITARNGNVYTVKNGELMRFVMELESSPISVIQQDKSIYIACMHRKLLSFQLRGKRNWCLSLSDEISAIESFNMKRTRDTKGILVALRSGEISLYNEKIKVCSVNIAGVPIGIAFGQYGREEASLIVITKSGGIFAKILKRSANLEATSNALGPPPEQDIPLEIPKKTKLFVEQAQRERDHATEMHQNYQRDLCKLRLTAARTYVQIIKSGQSEGLTGDVSIRLNAQVQGIGPIFKLLVSLQNTGTQTVRNLFAVFDNADNIYNIRPQQLAIPLLIPNILYTYAVTVECNSEEPVADSVQMYVCGKNSSIPIVTAIVAMPLNEPDIL